MVEGPEKPASLHSAGLPSWTEMGESPSFPASFSDIFWGDDERVGTERVSLGCSWEEWGLLSWGGPELLQVRQVGKMAGPQVPRGLMGEMPLHPL